MNTGESQENVSFVTDISKQVILSQTKLPLSSKEGVTFSNWLQLCLSLQFTLGNLSVHSREWYEISEMFTNITSYLMCSIFMTEDISNEYNLDSSIINTSTTLTIEDINVLYNNGKVVHSQLLFYRARWNEFKVFPVTFDRIQKPSYRH